MPETNNPFLPFIKDFEQEAEAFLVHYGFGDAAREPRKLPIEEIIRTKMSVDIIESECLSPDGSVQGITAFMPGIVEIYDPDLERYIGYELRTPAIMIDRDICSASYRRILLAHEAFHWYRHRHYFQYRSQHELGDGFAFRCNGRSSMPADGTWTDEQRMEWQARKIAPMILMPRQAVLTKAGELCAGNPVSDDVIRSISDFFGVTRYAAAKRLKDLGFPVCGGMDTECLERSAAGHGGSRNRPAGSHISLPDAFRLYQQSALFRDCVNTGQFVYQDGIIAAKFRGESDSRRTLIFEEALIPASGAGRSTGVMFHQDETYLRQSTFRNTPQNAQLLDEASVYERQFQAIHARKAENYKTANEILWGYMQKAHWNTSVFQDRTLLAPMDYVRVQKPEHVFRMPAYVAMCVGLGISITEFQEIIRHAGLALIDGNKEHDAYAFILSVMQGKTIDECNDFLSEIGIKMLGTHSR